MYLTRWAVVLAVAGIVPAAMFPGRTVAWLWFLGVLALGMIDALLAPRPHTLGLRRQPSGPVRLTESTTTTLHLVNSHRWRTIRGQVNDAWVPSAGAHSPLHRFSVRPGAATAFTTTLTPTRRGDRPAAAVTVRLSGPLRLGGRQKSVDVPAHLRVLPEFSSRRHLPARLRKLREIDGQSAVRLKGAGSEFDSLREYVIGDDVRTIDWRATARRADVVVKTYRPERDRRVMIVLDTSRLSAGRVEDAPRLDASIEAALLMSALAARAGDRTQVTAFDRTERARAAGLTPATVMPRVAGALASIQPSLVEPDWPALMRLVQSRLSQRALVVLLTTIDISNVDSGLVDVAAALGRDHQVMIGSVDNPELEEMLTGRTDTDALFAAGAAARIALEREQVATRLRHTGADVVQAPPQDLAPALADRYLALKATGLL